MRGDMPSATLCFSLYFPLVLFERGASLSFIYGYMGVRTCSHKTIYAINELP